MKDDVDEKQRKQRLAIVERNNKGYKDSIGLAWN